MLHSSISLSLHHGITKRFLIQDILYLGRDGGVLSWTARLTAKLDANPVQKKLSCLVFNVEENDLYMQC